MTVVRTGFAVLLTLLAVACSAPVVDSTPTPQVAPTTLSPTSTPEAPPTLSPAEVVTARVYVDWIVASFDAIAEQADVIIVLLIGADPASEEWLADAKTGFQRFADLIDAAQEYQEPDGIFGGVHRVYNGGLTEYEAASDLFFVWLDERETGDGLSSAMMTRFDQGQQLMNQTVIPIFRQAQTRLPVE